MFSSTVSVTLLTLPYFMYLSCKRRLLIVYLVLL